MPEFGPIRREEVAAGICLNSLSRDVLSEGTADAQSVVTLRPSSRKLITCAKPVGCYTLVEQYAFKLFVRSHQTDAPTRDTAGYSCPLDCDSLLAQSIFGNGSDPKQSNAFGRPDGEISGEVTTAFVYDPKRNYDANAHPDFCRGYHCSNKLIWKKYQWGPKGKLLGAAIVANLWMVGITNACTIRNYPIVPAKAMPCCFPGMLEGQMQGRLVKRKSEISIVGSYRIYFDPTPDPKRDWQTNAGGTIEGVLIDQCLEPKKKPFPGA